MRRQRLVWLGLVSAFTIGFSTGAPHIASAASSGPPMHMGPPHMGPVTFKNDHQVAPAVSAMLMPASSKTCGHGVTGSGSVKMIPVHVGKMSGPHVDLVVQLHNAGVMRKYGISGTLTGKAPIKWSGMAGSAETDMHGGIDVKMRLMPMMRAGSYTAQIMLHDMSCSAATGNSLAFQTPKTTINLK